MVKPQSWETWRKQVGDVLVNKRYSPTKEVTVTFVDYNTDSQADFIKTSDPGVYGCAIALEDAGWHKK